MRNVDSLRLGGDAISNRTCRRRDRSGNYPDDRDVIAIMSQGGVDLSIPGT